ncbi:glutamine synthetase family protein [Alicyclobacillus ferrooxydans]|uniref:Glutamate--ammonia ligase n=1 Tax=Alicyclobacillus ferrooxydans TaxID=471514 RepID=A0A0P9EJ23_9BACL|nr:glutamine synthetase family protein [Alicyclobacillus ferrooxydans]KPV42894.1 glutamate--ammonia ligase [Alicyclobacillus ferrooxydans]
MNMDDVVRQAEEAGVELVEFLFVDNGGTIRGKLTHVDHLRSRMQGGIGLTPAMMAMNMLDQLQPIPEMGPVGEVRLMPDPDSFRVLPYSPKVAVMMCDQISLNHEPWEACPRSFLKSVIRQAEAMGISIMATYEDEFTLARIDDNGQYVPIDEALCFSSIAMDVGNPVILDIMRALKAQGIQPEQYYPELGHGQHELSISPTDLLTAADNQVRYRETVRAVAKQHGMVASFAPKPFANEAGNGAHIHFSLWDREGKKNLFWDPSDNYKLSQTGYQFAAGILRHLPGLVAITCASFNSYRRLNPRSWSSAYTAFGPDNREAAVRIASTFWGNEEKSMNMELKSSDSSANPYLALGATVAAGLDGIRNNWHPGTGVEVDPATLTEREREERGIVRLPSTLREAVDALEADSFFTKTLGDLLTRSYTAVKRSEYAAFSEQDTAFELKHHFYKF